MRIGLVNLREDKGCPPIGLVYLATSLKKELPEILVKIIDINYDNIFKEVLKYDLIGISAMTIDYGKAIRLAEYIKSISKIPIIIGGVHISTLPESFKKCFNGYILGEGEYAFSQLIKDILKNKEENILDGYGLYNKSLDDLPLPNWNFVNKNYFRYDALTTWGEFGREGAILTARGCPYKCVFCSTSAFWQDIRFYSAEYVINMIKDLVYNYGITHIQIWDDLFVINKKRLYQIRDLLHKENLIKKVKFNCQPRADLINNEICELLKDMNVKIALFGFESGNDRMLRFLKKSSISVETNKKAIQLCNKYNIKVQGSIIFGSPTETLSEMQDTLDFIDYAYKNKVNRLWSFVMTPFPATEMWQYALLKNKVSDDMDWEKLNHQGINNPLLLDSNINKEDFKRIFLESRKKLNKFKWRKIWSFFKNNPFMTCFYILIKPYKYLYILISKRIF